MSNVSWFDPRVFLLTYGPITTARLEMVTMKHCVRQYLLGPSIQIVVQVDLMCWCSYITRDWKISLNGVVVNGVLGGGGGLKAASCSRAWNSSRLLAALTELRDMHYHSDMCCT